MEKQQLSETVEVLLNEGHAVELRAFGYSMFPFLKPGSSVKVEPVSMATIQRGDLVAFRKQDYLVIHRTQKVAVVNELVLLHCKGDSNLSEDDPVDAQHYIGKVTAIKRKKKWKSLQKKSVLTWFILLLGNVYSFPFWMFKHVRAKVIKELRLNR